MSSFAAKVQWGKDETVLALPVPKGCQLMVGILWWSWEFNLFIHPVFIGEGLIFLFWPRICRISGPQNQEQVPPCLKAETSVKPPSFLQWAVSESAPYQASFFGSNLHFIGHISIIWIICIPGACSFLFPPVCQIFGFLYLLKTSPPHTGMFLCWFGMTA